MKLSIIVHPRSKRPRIEKDASGTLHVYVAAMPIDGKANEAVIIMVAQYLKVPKTGIRIVKGLRSKHKVINVL